MGKLYECILYILSFYFPGNRKVFPGFPGNKAPGNTATLTNIHFNGVLIIYTKYYTCLFVSSQLIEETSHFHILEARIAELKQTTTAKRLLFARET